MDIGDLNNTDLYDTGASPFSEQYYRDKIAKYQDALIGLDIAVDAAWDLVAAGADDDVTQQIYDWLGEVDALKTQLKTTAQALNLGAQAANAVGLELPSIEVPRGLALVPLTLPIVTIAAVAVAVSLTASIFKLINTIGDYQMRKLAIESASPEARDSIIQAGLKIDEAKAKAGLFGQSGGSLMMVGLGVLALLLLKGD